MEFSADPMVAGDELAARVVIVGAGPAGIVTALELADEGIDVLLVERGEWGHKTRPAGRFEPDLARSGRNGASRSTSRHVAQSISTRQQVGGTSVIWGGRCVPYDPVDFDRRPYVADSAWPISYEEVSSYHRRASEYLHCGAPQFDAMEVPELAARLLAPGLANGDVRASDLERWSLPTNFGKEYEKRLKRHRRLRLVTGLTCVEVVSHPSTTAASHLRCVTRQGHEVIVRGDEYVLATGGLAATRLLMNSDRLHPGGMGDHAGHLGRWYMAHMDGIVAQVQFAGDPRRTLIAHERDAEGVYVRRRLSFSREALHKHELPNIVAWPVNPQIADASHGNGALSSAFLALTSPLSDRFATDALRLKHTQGHVSPRAKHVRNVVGSPVATAGFLLGFGYRRFFPWRRAPGFFVRTADNRYPLNYHGEQVPTRESRVTLTADRDDVGMRRLLVDLRFTEQDFDGVVRAHELWHDDLVRRGAGRLIFNDGDLRESVYRQTRGGVHQIGTTRMSAAPEDGVLAPDLTVHGIDNLSVVSSSAFPSSGQANPTFTVVAFALRRADALRERLRASRPRAEGVVLYT